MVPPPSGGGVMQRVPLQRRPGPHSASVVHSGPAQRPPMQVAPAVPQSAPLTQGGRKVPSQQSYPSRQSLEAAHEARQSSRPTTGTQRVPSAHSVMLQSAVQYPPGKRMSAMHAVPPTQSDSVVHGAPHDGSGSRSVLLPPQANISGTARKRK